MLESEVRPMTIQFTKPSTTSGDEDIELLKALCYEYLADLSRRGRVEFMETVGTDGFPMLLAIIPNAKILEGKIVDANNPVSEAVGSEEVAPKEKEEKPDDTNT